MEKEVNLIKKIDNGIIYTEKRYSKKLYKLKENANKKIEKFMERLSNRYIVHYINYIENDDYISFIMEYCEGKTLNEYLVKNIKDNGYRYRFREKEIYRFLIDLLHGLNYLHQNSIIHGNITPNSIYITVNREFILADYIEHYCIERIDKLYQPSSIYTAPELISGTISSPNILSDMYSLGCVLYQVFTCLPYNKQFFHSYNYNDLYLEELIRRLLSEDPLSRPTTSEILGDNEIKNKVLGCIN